MSTRTHPKARVYSVSSYVARSSRRKRSKGPIEPAERRGEFPVMRTLLGNLPSEMLSLQLTHRIGYGAARGCLIENGFTNINHSRVRTRFLT